MLRMEGSFLPLDLAVMPCLRPDASRQTNRWQEDPMPLWRSVEIGNGIMKSSGSSATTTPSWFTRAISVMQRIVLAGTRSLVAILFLDAFERSLSCLNPVKPKAMNPKP